MPVNPASTKSTVPAKHASANVNLVLAQPTAPVMLALTQPAQAHAAITNPALTLAATPASPAKAQTTALSNPASTRPAASAKPASAQSAATVDSASTQSIAPANPALIHPDTPVHPASTLSIAPTNPTMSRPNPATPQSADIAKHTLTTVRGDPTLKQPAAPAQLAPTRSVSRAELTLIQSVPPVNAVLTQFDAKADVMASTAIPEPAAPVNPAANLSCSSSGYSSAATAKPALTSSAIARVIDLKPLLLQMWKSSESTRTQSCPEPIPAIADTVSCASPNLTAAVKMQTAVVPGDGSLLSAVPQPTTELSLAGAAALQPSPTAHVQPSVDAYVECSDEDEVKQLSRLAHWQQRLKHKNCTQTQSQPRHRPTQVPHGPTRVPRVARGPFVDQPIGNPLPAATSSNCQH